MPAAALATLIPAAIQLGTSIYQGSQAKKMEGQYSRPNYEVPQGMLDAVDIYKNLALQTGLPRQDLIEEKLDESGANALAGLKEAATNPWDVIKGSQRIAETQAEKSKDLGIAGAQFATQAKQDYSGILQGLSQLQEKQFMYNEFQPYTNAMDAIRRLRESGTQNLYSGASNVAGVMASSPDMFKGLFGEGKDVTAAQNRLEGLNSAMEEQLRYKAPNE